MALILKVKFEHTFKDGNISPRLYRVGEVVELDEVTVQKIRQSGGVVEILEKRVPKPQKAVEDEA